MAGSNLPNNPLPGPPLWLLAEVTYRCPLHCVYCSNPLDFAKVENELSTEDWKRVFREARALGGFPAASQSYATTLPCSSPKRTASGSTPI